MATMDKNWRVCRIPFCYPIGGLGIGLDKLRRLSDCRKRPSRSWLPSEAHPLDTKDVMAFDIKVRRFELRALQWQDHRPPSNWRRIVLLHSSPRFIKTKSDRINEPMSAVLPGGALVRAEIRFSLWAEARGGVPSVQIRCWFRSRRKAAPAHGLRGCWNYL